MVVEMDVVIHNLNSFLEILDPDMSHQFFL